MPQKETRVVEIVIDAKQFRAATARVNKNLEGIRKQAISLNTAFRSMFAVFAIYGTQDAIRTLVTFTSQLQELDARLRAVVGSAEVAEAVFDDLFEVADRTGMRVQDLATMYARLGFATQQMTITHRELKMVVETVANTFRLSGTSAQEAASVSIQFTQALASGRLAGDELRSLLENNAVLAQLFADNIEEANGSIGRLRELGAEGFLTPVRLLEALRKGAAGVAADVENMGLSIQRALFILENQWSRIILLFERSGLGEQIGAGILSMAQQLETATPAIVSGLRTILNIGSEIFKMFQAIGGAALEMAQTVVGAMLRIGGAISSTFDDTSSSIRTNQELWDLFVYTIAVETPVRIRQLTDGFKILWNAIKLGLETQVVVWGNTFESVGAIVDAAWATMKAGVLSFFQFLLKQARLKLNEFVKMWTDAAANVVGFFNEAAAGAIRGAISPISESAAEAALGTRITALEAEAAAANKLIDDLDRKNAAFVEEQKQRAAQFIESTVGPGVALRGQLEEGLIRQGQALKDVNKDLDDYVVNAGRAGEAATAMAGGGGGGGGVGGANKALEDQRKRLQELRDAVRDLREEYFPAEKIIREFAETMKILNEALQAGIITQQTFATLAEKTSEKMREGLAEINEEASKFGDTSKNLAQPFVSAIDAMIMRTKSFSDIIRDLERALISAITQILVLKPLQEGLQNAFSSAGSGDGGGGFGGFVGAIMSAVFGGGGAAAGGAMQMGGPVSPGVPYLVGEAGPELIVPRMPGQVIPNDELGGQSVVVNVNFNGSVSGEGLQSSAQQIATQVGMSTQRALRRNG